MIPATYGLNLYRGDSWHWQVNVWANAARTQPVDLTGVVPKAEIRDKPAGSSITEIECTVILPNTVDCVLTAASSALLPKRGVWDLQLSYPSGDVSTVVGGSVAVSDDVTDSS
jgi:hypothetical protein